MTREEYERVWGKIRLIQDERLEFIIANGVEEIRYRICELFKNSELLNDRYIRRKTVEQIAKENDCTMDIIYRGIYREIGYVKIVLAEKGILENIIFGNESNYYNYIRNKICKNGVSDVVANEGVLCKDIAKALGVEVSSVNKKIEMDRKVIKETLENLNIKATKKSVDLYIRVFNGICKEDCKVAVQDLLYLDKLIKENEFLNEMFYSKRKNKQISNEQFEDIVFRIKNTFKKYKQINITASTNNIR